MVAGVRTQYEYVRRAALPTDELAMHYIEVDPYKAGGMIERSPFLGNRTKGSLRSFMCTLPLFSAGPIDAIWTQVDTALFPFLVTRGRLAHTPYVIATDATTLQIEQMADYGLGEQDQTISLKHRLRNTILAYCYQHAAYVLPWSRWAASAIMDEYAVPEERVRVLPPGVDLTSWRPRPACETSVNTPTRLLFVGGDFARKGGPLLLDVFREHLRGRCELHLVTRDPVEPQPGVHVYAHLSPTDGELQALYASCDALVLPTRADCFSLAAIEAMATGLPVITCPVGGIPEVVTDGETGWMVPVGDGHALHSAIEAFLADPARAREMGLRGRSVVEERFDAAIQARTLFDLMEQLAERQAASRAKGRP